jgi:hypothetical protein
MPEETGDVLQHIHNVLTKVVGMNDPHRPLIVYDDLMDAVVEGPDGWTVSHDGKVVLFVARKDGSEGLHEAVYELSCRYNGIALPNQKNRGFRA